MKTSESVSKITEALSKAESKIGHAVKNAQNPHLKNLYANLESVIDACKEALLENGIVVLQCTMGSALVTRLQHTSGEFFESDTPLILQKQDMQGLGSAITYARRYGLSSMLNISSEIDDDGNLASAGKPKAAKVVTKPAPSGPKDSLPF